jgi:hypothetical protein
MQLVNPAATFNCHYGAMTADYYPILARAVSRLPTNSAQARQELYERARTILLTQLGRKENSRLGAVGESVILETAILKVEAKAQSQYEIAREAFANSVPLHDADDKLKNSFDAVHELRAINASRSDNGIPAVAPDVASLLRKPSRKRCQGSRR